MVVIVLVRIDIHAAVVDVAHILVAIVGAVVVVVVDVGLLRWVRVVGLVVHSDTVVAEDACGNE